MLSVCAAIYGLIIPVSGNYVSDNMIQINAVTHVVIISFVRSTFHHFRCQRKCAVYITIKVVLYICIYIQL